MLSLLLALAAGEPSAAAARMNDVLAVGSHNSYKLAVPPEEMAALVATRGQVALGLDYGHRPLAEVLDAGARQLELDVFRDPAGGRFARPATVFGKGIVPTPTFAAAMARPGYKVLHMQDIDFRSNCWTFVTCLTEIRTWSKAHPDHVPILILVNAKEGASSFPNGMAALAYDEKAFDALDAEIRSVFAESELITPDQVQGDRATLREAVLSGGWPLMSTARGKVFFALDESPAKVAAYRGSRKSLEGRTMFVNTDEGSPAAAYLTLNDPIAQGKRIALAVKAGFIVRTRADADTWQARHNDVSMRTAAFSSGAQYVSTDYLWPDLRFAGGYAVHLTGGEVAACNPQRMADRCAGPFESLPDAAASGYLAPAQRPDLTKILAAPPSPDSPRAAADTTIFVESRALEGTARWAQASDDVDGSAYEHFAEALGVRLTEEGTPILTALLKRAGEDRSAVGAAKTHWGTKRPYLEHTDAPICEAKSAHLAGNPDYPSGHSAFGMHVAMILAELAPSRAEQLYARGRDFADSRWVCGSHSLSAAEAGVLSGATIYAAEQASPYFRRDMDAAHAELKAYMDAVKPAEPR